MTSKRITFLHHRLNTGGVDRVICYLAKGFADAGYDVELLLFCKGGKGEDALSPLLGAGVTLTHLGDSIGSRTKDLIRYLPACGRWLKANPSDCLISSSNNMNWITSIAAKLSGTNAKVILKATNPIVRKKSKLRKFTYGRAIKASSRMLALSDAETQILRREFPKLENRFDTVINPYVTEAMLAAQPVKTDEKIVLAIGRFEAQKNFDLLVESFAHVKTPNAKLVILGEGSQKVMCQEIAARLGITERVKMPGFVSDVTAWLQKSSLLAMTSRFEGLPAVVLEALATDCPVMATDCFPAARAILEPLNGCGIFESKSPEDIGADIDRALAQPNPIGLKTAAERYSIENGIQDHIRHVENVMR